MYLIAHKVRGGLAFDIADKIQIGDEEGWIVPTSGHRAYPWQHWKLDDLVDCSNGDSVRPFDLHNYDAELPPDLPEHYEVSAAPKSKGRGTQHLLELIGLAPKPMTRRSW